MVLIMNELGDVPQDDHLVRLHVEDDLNLLDFKDLGASLVSPVIFIIVNLKNSGVVNANSIELKACRA